jgi:acyl-CoA dehydrogenase
MRLNRLVCASATAAGSCKKGVDDANERSSSTGLIGQNQDIQFPLARAYAELQAADMTCRRAAALFDDGKECGADAVITRIC